MATKRSSDPVESSMTRTCDGKICLICSKTITREQDGVIITVPSKMISKFKKSTLAKFKCSWDITSSVNYGHARCWDNLNAPGNSITSTELRVISAVKETIERFCCYGELQRNVDQVVSLIMKSKSTVCFTGAGISSSAGIPTYRGATGIDTLEKYASSSIQVGADEIKDSPRDDVDARDVDYTLLQPTFSHLALAKLHAMGKLSYCITQNCDDLHAKAGIPNACITDIHGNVFVEYCEKCSKQYKRDHCVDVFSTDCLKEPYAKKCKTCGWNHYTGNICDNKYCNGKLLDSIVNFGDDLHEVICGGILEAERQCEGADVCICLGTSLSVSPANTLPLASKDRVIVNLQATDLDDNCAVRFWATSDDFFKVFMPALERDLNRKQEEGQESEQQQGEISQTKRRCLVKDRK